MNWTGPWGNANNPPTVKPHISSAQVALDGGLVAIGSLSHPTDDDGHFPSHVSECVRISRAYGMRIVRCRAKRLTSGFLKVDEFGSELGIPDPLSSMIEHALRNGAKQPIVVTLTHQAGQLADSTRTDKRLVQPLSDWTLDIREDQGHITVQLSAALHGLDIEEWQKSTSNYWSGQLKTRLEARLTVDPVTRIACFGSYVPSLPDTVSTPALLPEPSLLSTLDINNAPVGTFTERVFGDGRWFSFFEATSLSYLVIVPESTPSRTTAGFLGLGSHSLGPSVSIHGLTMDAIWFATRNSPTVKRLDEGECVGTLTGGGSDGWIEKITSVETEISLNETGLHFAIDIRAPRTSLMKFYLPWELLILRYPKFLHGRNPTSGTLK